MRDESKLILVTDDDPAIRGIVVALTKYMGYRTLEAGNKEELEQVLKLSFGDSRFGSLIPVDMVITDINMPGITGIELFWRIRKANLNIPFLFMSGLPAHHNSGLPEILREEKGVDFLPKPFRTENLQEKVKKLLL